MTGKSTTIFLGILMIAGMFSCKKLVTPEDEFVKSGTAQFTDKAVLEFREIIENKDETGVKAMIAKYDPNIIEQAGSMGTLIHYSVIYGNTATTEILIRSGGNINSTDSRYGNTPLHTAAKESAEQVELLLENGVKVNALNDCGQTPLYIAEKWNEDSAEILKVYGAELLGIPCQ